MPDDITTDYNNAHEVPKHVQSAITIDKIMALYADLVGGSDGKATLLTDLLADLMHWAVVCGPEETDDDEDTDEEHWTFESCLDSAEVHYSAESE